jgi:hypothetical protein
MTGDDGRLPATAGDCRRLPAITWLFLLHWQSLASNHLSLSSLQGSSSAAPTPKSSSLETVMVNSDFRQLPAITSDDGR